MALAPQHSGVKKLFGTDGVRGRAGSIVSSELAFALGRAATRSLDAPRPRVLVIRDTRVSGEMLESALAAGVASGGGQALLGGILPTPAASALVRKHGFDLGVVISASHNPYYDNGIKFFDAAGHKLSDSVEARIERLVFEQLGRGGENSDADPCGRVLTVAGAFDDYLRLVQERFPASLEGMRILLDCANGATFKAAPVLFSRLGAQVETIGCEPDGSNINQDCGSTHPEQLAARVASGSFDLGFAFDGDGDRMLAVDQHGAIVDGDEVIAQIALGLQRRGELRGGVAVTVMTNIGFHNAMRSAGIEVATTDVGDRWVVEELDRKGWRVGGEQSGHIVDMDFIPSGDGMAAALGLIGSLESKPLKAGSAVERLPQALVNVNVKDREALEGSTPVWEAVDRETEQLGTEGRVLLRPSGTEPVVRVMVEAPTQERSNQVAERLAQAVAAELG